MSHVGDPEDAGLELALALVDHEAARFEVVVEAVVRDPVGQEQGGVRPAEVQGPQPPHARLKNIDKSHDQRRYDHEAQCKFHNRLAGVAPAWPAAASAAVATASLADLRGSALLAALLASVRAAVATLSASGQPAKIL